ncbi:Hydrolase (HAD superfamily) [Leuconostoc gelidum subsp. gasicomitatum]|uniref:Hydrolase (HAD superfamily) n=1 Tax=Leuconostoc gasicomitatum TaxID=115778 RepID=A0ABP2BA78_9LACO|nr:MULTISPECIES: HAD family hydrolase [Leuconostoc gelidum group]MBZ5943758.1 HAD family phosphatase [Leuconostoc gasicomitatum]MBZ5945305.1 HAD family phosphatase [Leuconostoc gasicomitatum]MBZ5948740.1 HAD family phosphatase [Leuconostoc gasicomitatum]MBZ5951755.1 HAD family phosphatase [Leuconostoc gasicomitatum]MBZ5953232.1 HAD family phosphatase [Leuconostoc gasicomitatum]
MANIQLIATDLDGTFLSDDKSFDKALFRVVLDKLKNKNIQLAIATGVHQERINVLLADFLDEGMAYVTNNGARVTNADGQLIYERTMALPILLRVQQLLIDFPVKPSRGLVYSTDDTAYIPSEYAHITLQTHRRYFKKVIIFDDVSEIKAPILKVTMNWQNFDETQFYDVARQTLGDSVHITETGTGAIDIVAAGVNKAIGLKMLADNLGISMANIAAFGDGENDLEMLMAVGQPFIMPDASITGPFNPVSADNNHAGVLKTILDMI